MSAEDTRNLIRQLFCTRSKGAEIVECCAAALKLHALNVSHDDGHLCPLCSLVEQRHLAQVVGSLGGSLACTLAVWAVLEAWVSLWTLGLLLCLLVHGAVEVLLLT